MGVEDWDSFVDLHGHAPDEFREIGIDGTWRVARSHDGSSIGEMFEPVRCTCGRVYDIGKVEVTARYADCSVWKAPCCGRTADDRGETGWKSTQDYYPLTKRRGASS